MSQQKTKANQSLATQVLPVSLSQTSWRWGFGLVLCLAFGLRLIHLGGSFWLDEAAQVLESARPLAQQFDIIPDFQPPLFHLLVHFSLYVGSSEWWLRLMGAVIPGLITIAATMQLAKRWSGPTVALVAGVLLATNSLHIFFSQELRPYSLALMWGMLSWWLVADQRAVPLQRDHWIAWWWLSVAGWFTSYLYPFMWLGQVGYLWWRQPHQRRLLVATCAAVGAAFALWLPIFRQQLAAGGEVRQYLPGWDQVVSIPQLKALPLVAAKMVFGVLDLDMNGIFIAISVLVAGLVTTGVWQLLQHKKQRQVFQQHLWLWWWWAIAPLVLAWLISFKIPVIQPKRVLFVLPALVLLWAEVSVRARKMVGYSLLMVLIAINAWSGYAYLTNTWYQRENWRGLYQTISQRYSPADTVAVFRFPEPFAPWRWYDQQSYPTLSTGVLAVAQVEDLATFLKPATEYKYIITFDYLQDLSDPQRQLEAQLAAYGYQQIDMIDYPHIGFTRVFARPYQSLTSIER